MWTAQATTASRPMVGLSEICARVSTSSQPRMNVIRRTRRRTSTSRRGKRLEGSAKTPRGVGELAPQLLVGGEDVGGEQAAALALDLLIASRRQPPQLGPDAGAALLGPGQGVGDTERVMGATC